MHTNHKFILVNKRDNRIILSGDDREVLVERATTFTVYGGGDTYSIFRNEMEVTNIRSVVTKSFTGDK